MAETIFQKPLDAQVALNTDAITKKSVSITVASGYTMANDLVQIGDMIHGSIRFTGSMTANTWTLVGTTTLRPVSTMQTVAFNTANVSYVGIMAINTDGTVKVYAKTNASDTAMGVFSHKLK